MSSWQFTHWSTINIVDRKHGIVVHAFRVDASGDTGVYVPIDTVLDNTEETSQKLAMQPLEVSPFRCFVVRHSLFTLAPGESWS